MLMLIISSAHMNVSFQWRGYLPTVDECWQGKLRSLQLLHYGSSQLLKKSASSAIRQFDYILALVTVQDCRFTQWAQCGRKLSYACTQMTLIKKSKWWIRRQKFLL